MNNTASDTIPPHATSALGSPLTDPSSVIVGQGVGLTNFGKTPLEVIMQMPLPGVVIFVHGVNSDGEWYSETEEGLCQGLNDRLARNSENLKFDGKVGGQLSPTKYLSELTDAGFINPDMNAKTFMGGDDTFSPVIHFRWGYKGSPLELQAFGNGIYLNEEDYWGGGPFANGCTALADLWGEGLMERLFLWLNIQHLNPANERQVYSCPPRPYYVLAALRLARLVESLRKKQADVPITIVCHSQGNMIGMAAAFLGDTLVKDAGVADTYVLCNAPYSLIESNGTEQWTERYMSAKDGSRGRVSSEARKDTLAAFFALIGGRKSKEQAVKRVDDRMANEAHGFTAKVDRDQYGYKGSTYGRVTLYCNPHDQVISSSPVQGIGWRGMSADEIDKCKGQEVFSQRVFAQGFLVGKNKGPVPVQKVPPGPQAAPGAENRKGELRDDYDYWADHWRPVEPGNKDFWYPNSIAANYSLNKGLESNENKSGWNIRSLVSALMTIVSWPIIKLGLSVHKLPINEFPPKVWKIPLTAPNLPLPFMPRSKRFGISSDHFDQGYDSTGESRNKDAKQDGPLAGDRTIPKGGKDEREDSDAAKGSSESQAAMSYEMHAQVRMQAKRENKYANDAKVTEEDSPETASAGYKKWHDKQIKTILDDNLDAHATDHSTIMTNGEHARKALAYDVAIGNCDILEEDLHALRVAADWRFLKGLEKDDPNKVFEEYFKSGLFKKVAVFKWANASGSEGSMPDKIHGNRETAAPQKGENP